MAGWVQEGLHYQVVVQGTREEHLYIHSLNGSWEKEQGAFALVFCDPAG